MESVICRILENGITNQKRVGVELEHFVCDGQRTPIPFDTLEPLMRRIAERSRGELYFEEGRVVGIKYASYSISLEPAGQVEISMEPSDSLKRIEEIYDGFCLLWDQELRSIGYHMETWGVFPLVENGEYADVDMPLIPKKRYEIMDQHFADLNGTGRYMMRCTASTQISIDYSSMEDAMRKIRILEKISPLLQLLMENRCGGGLGKRWKAPHLLRTQIWDGTDADRSGYIPGSLNEGYTFRDYAQQIVGRPLVVGEDGGHLFPGGSRSAKQLAERYRVSASHIMSMFFFHIRLKTYIEIRVADSVPKERMLAYAALVKALLYRPDILSELEEMFASVHRIEEIKEAETSIMQDGYQARVYGGRAVDLLVRIYELARRGTEGENAIYLDRILTLPMLEYLYCRDISKAMQAHCESAVRMQEYVLQSTAKYHNRVVRTLYVPKMFRVQEVRRFEGLVRTLYGIVAKVMQRFVSDEAYRARFGFSDALNRLILKPVKYSCLVPISRVDLFYDEQTGDFTFCEFNTDGTSAMNEDRELNLGLQRTLAYREFCRRYPVETCELFDSWVDAFLADYQEYAAAAGREKQPNVAIVDFLDKGTVNEFQIFQMAFESRGLTCEICDIRELSFDGTVCRSGTGMRIDAVYRRAVTSDIMENYAELTDFIRAAEQDAFCLIGDFRTEIMHNKVLFKILHSDATMELLDPQERRFVKAHVPYTVSLTQEVLEKGGLGESVLREKDLWIIKPEDSYGSKGVHAGVECTDEEWRDYVQACTGHDYILQSFCTPYRTWNIDLAGADSCPEWRPTSNLTGLFVYNGCLKGIYSRISYDRIISTQYNEMTLPTIIIKEEF